MSVIGAALITFFAFALLSTHLGRKGMMRVAGYAAYLDLIVHGSMIALFLGTSTLGLMQAELSAILFTVSLRTYRYFIGFSRLERDGYKMKWRTYLPTRFAAATA